MRIMSCIEFRRPIVLATASPARCKLVSEAGIAFTAQVVSIDERPAPGEGVAAYVQRLAEAKAEASVPPTLDAVIVAVDTAIGLAREIIGKPEDEAHARAILEKLSGRTHEVLSAMALRDVANAAMRTEVTRTEVEFVRLTDRMIDWYISTGEWKGRAGAYAIQEKGACLVKSVKGCFTNVIGISMPALFEMLEKTRG